MKISPFQLISPLYKQQNGFSNSFQETRNVTPNNRLPPEIFQDASPAKNSKKLTPDRPQRKRKNMSTLAMRATKLLKTASKVCSKMQEKPTEFDYKGIKMKSVGTQVENILSARMSYEQCVFEKDFQFLCGLSLEQFDHLYSQLGDDAVFQYLKYQEGRATPKNQRPNRQLLSLRGKLFLTLVRLRRGFSEKELAFFFGVSTSTVSRVCKTWIQVLFLELSRLKPFTLPSTVEQDETKPACFNFVKSCRCVVDCFEMKTQRASNFAQQVNLYSDYKSSSTVKFLVAVSLRGGISFVSEGFEGSASDKNVFLSCGLADMLEPGDGVMVDRGFHIENEMRDRGVHVIIPPFQDRTKQATFTGVEVLRTRKIANARIHVERVIGKIRNWNITVQTIPQALLPMSSQIAYVCALLTNYRKLDL